MTYRAVLANAFSLGMLPPGAEHTVKFVRSTPEWVSGLVRAAIKVVSAIRHPATEALAFSLLGLDPDEVEKAPAVTFGRDDCLIVFLPRWKGGRPPETREFTLEEIRALAEGVDVWVCGLA